MYGLRLALAGRFVVGAIAILAACDTPRPREDYIKSFEEANRPNLPPTVFFRNPTSTRSEHSEQVLAKIHINDDYGISQATLKLDGKAIPGFFDSVGGPGQKTGEWEYGLSCPLGRHELEAVVVDDRGVSARANVTFSRELPPSSANSAPSLAIGTPADGKRVSTETVSIAGEAGDDGRVVRVEVRVNGSAMQSAQLDGSDFRATAQLRQGTNKIEVTAIDDKGKSTTRSLEVVLNARSRYFVLAVGIDKYPSGGRIVPRSARSTEALQRFFASHDCSPATGDGELRILTNEHATRLAILTALKDFAKKANRASDVVVVSFVGVSRVEDEVSYLLPFSDLSEPSFASGIPLEELQRELSPSKSECRLWLIDTHQVDETGVHAAALTYRDDATSVIVSCLGADRPPVDNQIGRRGLIKWVITGLETLIADKNTAEPNGEVSVTELVNYVADSLGNPDLGAAGKHGTSYSLSKESP